MPAPAKSYTENFDTLLALVTHLASTHLQSRTVPGLARDLGFNAEDVRTVLNGFPGMFRKSRSTDRAGEPYYSVHLRYARRSLSNEPNEHEAADADNEPLNSEELSSLFQLITQMVAHESERSNLLMEFRQRNHALLWTNAITLIAALVAAVAAIYAAT
jgi:hypothetical protein